MHFDSPSDDKRRRAAALEREAVEACDFVSIVTRDWVETLRARYREQPAEKFLLTPNGYDPEMFADFRPRRRDDGKMEIAYFGTLHNNRIYSPVNYLAALDALPAEARAAMETRFIGRITPEAQPLLAGRSDVQCCGFMAKTEGLRELETADVLLLIATGSRSHARRRTVNQQRRAGGRSAFLSKQTKQNARNITSRRIPEPLSACGRRAPGCALIRAMSPLSGRRWGRCSAKCRRELPLPIPIARELRNTRGHGSFNAS